MGRKFGFSFSWKRAVGISGLKNKISKSTGVPLTSQGRQRKVGSAVGCAVFLPILFCIVCSIPIAVAAGACSGHEGVNCAAGADSDGSVICTDGWKGSSVQFSNVDECKLSPSAPESTMVQAVFTDVLPSNSFYPAIKYLKDNKIIAGYSDGSFKPSNPVNRAEFTKIVIGALSTSGSGQDCFSDVHSEWFASYVCYAKSKNIIGGYADGTFRPTNNVNLAEALKIVLLALQVPLSTTTGANWYDVYVNTANEKTFLKLINPSITHEVTRGEMAQLIYAIKLGI